MLRTNFTFWFCSFFFFFWLYSLLFFFFLLLALFFFIFVLSFTLLRNGFWYWLHCWWRDSAVNVKQQHCWSCDSAGLDGTVLLIMWQCRCWCDGAVAMMRFMWQRFMCDSCDSTVDHATVPLLMSQCCRHDATVLSIMRQCPRRCDGAVDVIQQLCWSCNGAVVDVTVLSTWCDSGMSIRGLGSITCILVSVVGGKQKNCWYFCMGTNTDTGGFRFRYWYWYQNWWKYHNWCTDFGSIFLR